LALALLLRALFFASSLLRALLRALLIRGLEAALLVFILLLALLALARAVVLILLSLVSIHSLELRLVSLFAFLFTIDLCRIIRIHTQSTIYVPLCSAPLAKE
jgi:hypothetical protein